MDMNHGGMDHAGMGHGESSTMMMDMNGTTPMGGHGMMGMNMYFTTDWKGSYLLFQSWQLNETWQLALACVFLAIATALYEGLKVLRETLLVWSMKSGASGSSYNTSKTRGSSIRARMCTCHHLLQSVLHVIQVTLSYFLMLAVMTFNVYIGLSIVLGAGVGYFLFGWKRAIVNDVNEHCH